MQSPIDEIPSVVKGLIESSTATDQQSYLTRYFSPDASFDHPLCAVVSAPNSRDQGVAPIYRFLRVMFTPKIIVSSVAFDTRNSLVYLDCSQTLISAYFPLNQLFHPTCRLLVQLHLHRGADGLFYIHRQEDFYNPQVMPGQILPGGYSLVMLVKIIAGINCAIGAWFVATFLGIWKLESKKGKGSNKKVTSSNHHHQQQQQQQGGVGAITAEVKGQAKRALNGN